MKKTILLILSYLLAIQVQAQFNVVVAKDGSGNFTTIQAAIDAAPTGQTSAYKIFIKNGKYREVVTIPTSKSFLQLIGESSDGVVISFDNYSGKPIPGGGGTTYGTNNCATLFVNANDCGVFNLTVENGAGYVGDGPQAVALYVSGDRCVFRGCRFISGQDTIWNNGNGKRNYFRNCYVDGNTDFIFGSMIAVYDSCVIYGRDRVDAGSGGYVTAANTPQGQAYGYAFRDCQIPANRGVTKYSLGRPWQNDAGSTAGSRSNSKVVWLNTRMSTSIAPTGWSTWDAGTDVSVITYAEYKTKDFDGTLHDVSNRLSWTKQLTDAEAAPYLVNSNLFGSWDPCSVATDVCTPLPTPLAVNNFRGKKGSSTSAFSWNIDWPVAGVNMDLQRSTDNISFTSINQQISPNDTIINFTYSEANPPAGQSYYYILKASKTGYNTTTASDTVVISSTPTITITGSLGSFLQGVGTPSAQQTYTVSGTNLLSDVFITAPNGYEISINGGSSWNNSSSPVVISPVNGTLSNTTITIRLNATSAGTYNGNIIHTSSGAATVNVPVTGTVQSGPLVLAKPLLWWPMATSNMDSASARSTAVAAASGRLNNLYEAQGYNGIPAYSATYGQALSAVLGTSSANDGSWGTPSGGPGGNVNRTFYESFTIKASGTNNIRLDSLVLKAAFTSSANGRLAAVYSRTGFSTNDSTNVPGATFAAPLVLSNYNTGFSDIRLAFNGSSGITLVPGDSVTVRIYLAVGTNNVPRFGVLKDVMFKGADSVGIIVPPPTGNNLLPAFPGAEGAGMYTTGGRGTSSQPTNVFEVTSLDDTNTPGTLRYAVSASQSTYPYRTILFRVSGTIHLTSKMNIRSNTTIAGQTAPGDGICLADYPVVISGDNVILRYLRVRMGDKNQLKTNPAGCGVPVAPFSASCTPVDGSGGDDALGNLGNKNLIIDHCSVSWSSDEALTVYRGDSVTMQWNFIEEPLNYSYHFETGDADFEQHGYGGIWGSKHGSFHHNLIAHAKNRLPRWGGNNTYAAGEIEQSDFRNNVIYDWGINNVYGGEGGNYNLVNNYYKYGPSTSSGVRYRIVGVDSNAAYGWAQYYLSGNYVDGSAVNTANNWSGAYMIGGNAADSVKSKQTAPFLSSYPQITLQSATEAYESVLNNAGASLPRRDTLDRRIVNDVRYRTGRLIDVQGGYPHGTPYAQTVNAWPTLNSTAAPIDTDHDGMPDSWETSHNSDPNDASDRQKVATNGYTNLENYLNNISNVSPEVYFTGSLTNFAQAGTTPSAVQSITVTGANLNAAVVLTAPAGFEISIDGGTTWISSSNSITLTPNNGSVAATLSIRLNAASSGDYTGSVTAVTTGVATFYLNVAGTRTPVSSGPVTATWKLLTDDAATVTGSVTATNQTIGNAISGIQYNSSFGGVNGWQRVGTVNKLPLVYTATSYVEYAIAPATGKTLNVTSFSMGALGGGTGNAKVAIYYSTDNFATSASIGAITYNSISYANTTTSPVSLLNTSTTPLTGQQILTASPNINVPAGGTLLLRMYVWSTTVDKYFTSQNVTLGGTTNDIILPLQVVRFAAALDKKQAKLIWTTTYEETTSKFEIESSDDAVRFKTIGAVTARHNAATNDYTFTDPQALAAVKYYRLKIISKDGSFTYSKVLTLNPGTEGKISLFPNPAVNSISVTYPITIAQKNIQLYAADGRLLQTISLSLGSTQTSIDVKNLVSGSYYLKLSENGTVVPFIKQ